MNWLALVLAATAAPSLAGDDLYTRYFAAADGGKPCYLRVYDAAHLKSHPKQTVRRIFVDFDAGFRSDETRKNGPDNRFHAAPFGRMVRSGAGVQDRARPFRM